MAGTKSSSSLPAKKTGAKTAKPKAPARSSLSTKFVKDSDNSDEEERSLLRSKVSKTGKSNAVPAKLGPAKTTSSSREQSKKRRTLIPSPAKNGVNGSGRAKPTEVQELDDSEDEHSSSSRDSTPTLVKQTPAPIQPAKSKPLQSSTNGRTLNWSEPVSVKNGKGKAKEEPSEEDSEISGSCSSESGNESEGESDSGSSDKTSLQSPRKSSPIRKPASTPVQIPYEPPPGFELASISFHPSSKVSEIFSPSNLEGKQIWHIIVPGSVPMPLIDEVSAQSIENGASVFSHKGADYGLVPESMEQASNRALLLPSTQTNDYRPYKIPIIKTLHLQQLVSLPSRSYAPTAIPNASSKAQTHVKAPRQQPQGLKMRYHAFGVSDDSDSDISATGGVNMPQFRVLGSVQEGQHSKKRKLSDSGENSTKASPTKTKKQKARHETPVETKGSPMEIDSHINGEVEPEARPSQVSPMKANGAVPNATDPELQDATKEIHKRKKKKKQHQSTPTATKSILPLDVTKEAETIIPEEVINNDTAITQTSHPKDSKEERVRQKEEQRKRKEAGSAATFTPPAKTDDFIQQQSESHPREQSVHLPTPRHSSPQKQDGIVRESPAKVSSQGMPRKESKEERAKRKREKRKRKVASDLY